jgi:hypothetical protein
MKKLINFLNLLILIAILSIISIFITSCNSSSNNNLIGGIRDGGGRGGNEITLSVSSGNVDSAALPIK